MFFTITVIIFAVGIGGSLFMTLVLPRLPQRAKFASASGGNTMPAQHRQRQAPRRRAQPLEQQPVPPVVVAPRQLRRLPMKTYRLRQRRKVQRMTAVIKAQGERIKELEAKLLETLVLAEV